MLSQALILVTLFCAGSLVGWFLEFFYRKRFSGTNPEHKWINPGFCSGPWLPLYGFGVVTLYLLARLERFLHLPSVFLNRTVLFLVMAICMTVVEYIAGIFCLKYYKVRLWDYREKKGNIQGLICPEFSFYWAILGAVYYFAVDPFILHGLEWLANNLAYCFFIGMFFGIYLLDIVNSCSVINKIRAFANENDIIVRFERFKKEIRDAEEEAERKLSFLFPLRSHKTPAEILRDAKEDWEERKQKISGFFQ